MKNKINISTTKLLFVVLLALFVDVSGFAQTNAIYNLTENSATSVNARVATPSITRYPTSLLYDLQPSIYVEQNAIINVNGIKSPKVLKMKDTQSFELVKTRNQLYKDIEMITINLKTVSDLSRTFDVDSIRGFNHLKYIYLKSDFPLTVNQIREFILNADPEINIFYKNLDRS